MHLRGMRLHRPGHKEVARSRRAAQRPEHGDLIPEGMEGTCTRAAA